MDKKEILGQVKRVVIKVGTTTLTHDTGLLNLERIEILVRQISNLHNHGYEVVLVTSGAIGAGMGKLNLNESIKQASEIKKLVMLRANPGMLSNLEFLQTLNK